MKPLASVNCYWANQCSRPFFLDVVSFSFYPVNLTPLEKNVCIGKQPAFSHHNQCFFDMYSPWDFHSQTLS